MKSKNQNNFINIQGARENNLKNINISIPRKKLVVITGMSGSGKSSLAYNTIYAEGQRRYVESLSAYARQFLGIMDKPKVDNIDGLSPAISIEQKVTSRNPRSTVGTITEIHDYLRLLYARVGTQFCYRCNRPVENQTIDKIIDSILALPEGKKIQVLSPVVRGRKGQFKELFKSISNQGFVRIRINKEEHNLPLDFELNKNKKHNIDVVVDRLVIKDKVKERLTSSVELALKLGNGLLKIETDKEKIIFNENYSCTKCDLSFESLEPRMFSFNSPFGACKKCSGLGTEMSMDPDLIVQDKTKSILKGCILPLGEQPRGGWWGTLLKNLAREHQFSFTIPWNSLDQDVKDIILYGTKKKKISRANKKSQFFGENKTRFEGVIPNLERRYSQTTSRKMREWIEKFMAIQPCSSCNGGRLNKSNLSVRIDNLNISDISELTISKLSSFVDTLKFEKQKKSVAHPIIKEISVRLSFLIDVGLEYLTLSRKAGTLSGGEAQRIKLATQIGSRLVGVLYILDEPTIGLHQRDNRRLINTLKGLRDLGNTVIVVEHDKEIMLESDYIVDIGPGAGENGGYIIAEGSPEKIKKNKRSLTGQYLSNRKEIKFPAKNNLLNLKHIELNGASGNNLKNVNLKLPIGNFICITGVSGSGKSSLINQTLFPALSYEFNRTITKPLQFKSLKGTLHLDKVINIDQSPIGKTPRSNPATYTGLFTHIRELFTQIPESKVRGYKPGRFSFNVKGGRCENCQGGGLIKIEMHFLPDMYIRCDECQGKRYNRDTLEILYKGKNISDILSMSVEKALIFFKNHNQIKRKLQTLVSVGLGYITLGQQATTLSGGEAQRVKLSSELSKIGTGRTLYILDEPTTGLHFEDVKMLLSVLHSLVNKGNTVLIIEHNLDVIKTADWVIDLGPEGGSGGGNIIAEGHPKAISKTKTHTGKYLKLAFAE